MGNKDGFLDTWTQEEEETVVSLHDTLGSRWDTIASSLPGRSADDIQNWWSIKGRWRNM